MFVQGAVGGNADSRGFRVRERYLCLSDGLRAVDPGFHQSARQLERLPVGLDGAVIQILERILPAEFEVILRQGGLFRQALVFEVRGAHLGGVPEFADRVADAAP